MAKYTSDGIYTFIRNRILAVYSDMYVTAGEEPIPARGPAVRVREVDRYKPIRNITLMHDDGQFHAEWEVQVYSNLFNGRTSEAYDIMEVAESAFRELFFIESSCVPVERANNRVTRLVARFERQIGGGDQMPNEEEP